MYFVDNYISDYRYSSNLHIPVVNPFTGDTLTKTDEEVAIRLCDYVYDKRNKNIEADKEVWNIVEVKR